MTNRTANRLRSRAGALLPIALLAAALLSPATAAAMVRHIPSARSLQSEHVRPHAHGATSTSGLRSAPRHSGSDRHAAASRSASEHAHGRSSSRAHEVRSSSVREPSSSRSASRPVSRQTELRQSGGHTHGQGNQRLVLTRTAPLTRREARRLQRERGRSRSVPERELASSSRPRPAYAEPQSIVILKPENAVSRTHLDGGLQAGARFANRAALAEPASADAPADDSPTSAALAQPSSVVGVIRRAGNDRPQLLDPLDSAAAPEILPSLYDERGRLVVPPALRGSHEILVHQNTMANQDGLRRILDDDDLLDARNQGLLVALPASDTLRIDERLPYNRRYARPWTAHFLAVIARAYYMHFHQPLQVNSAVRTVAFQQRLMRTNGNAAPFEGDTASPHLTGQAVDIAKRGLSTTQIAWMRGYLLPLMQSGKIDVEEEFQQACFHISVYRSYAPVALPPRQIVTTHREGTGSIRSILNP
jgi:hypothetical protein